MGCSISQTRNESLETFLSISLFVRNPTRSIGLKGLSTPTYPDASMQTFQFPDFHRQYQVPSFHTVQVFKICLDITDIYEALFHVS